MENLSKNYVKSKLSSHLPKNCVSRLQYREVRDSFKGHTRIFSVIAKSIHFVSYLGELSIVCS